MLRLNLVLLLLVMVSALGAVAAQHRSTRLYQGIQNEIDRAKRLENDYTELNADFQRLAAHANVARIARERLRMQAAASAADRSLP
ncbi:MAG: cell division protein FtsL [Zoogloeaceae bacterium]|jgi:cell division protein FtsL|nr:cell division protein FtsL [Zoogloeaceae bacterium]